jgi:hypothetical protein
MNTWNPEGSNFSGMHLRWFGDPEPPEQPADTGVSDTAPAGEPFFRLDDKTAFNTPDELKKAFTEGTMRHSEYKSKMQEYQDNFRKLENDRAAHFRQVAEYDRKRKEWDKYEQLDKIMKSNPAAARQMMQLVQGTPQGEDLFEAMEQRVEEKYGPKFKMLEEEEKKRRAQEEMERTYGELVKKFPDADRTVLQKEFDTLMSPESSMMTLLEYIYHAVKGRGIDPAKIEEELVENHEKKQKASIPSARGASSPQNGHPDNETIEEVRERVKKKYGGK